MKSYRQWMQEDYGQVLFAPQRTDTPSREPNTPEEDDAWDAFQQHYFGGNDQDLNALMPEILAAKQSGKYADFLNVPDKYPTAYRLMADVPEDVLLHMLAQPLGSAPRGVIHGGTYRAKNDPVNVSSWTVDPAVIIPLVDDFGTLYRRHPVSFHVILVADIGENREQFLINPDKYKAAPTLAGHFSYQKEILSTGVVALKRIIYCNKDEFDGSDRRIVKWLIQQL